MKPVNQFSEVTINYLNAFIEHANQYVDEPIETIEDAADELDSLIEINYDGTLEEERDCSIEEFIRRYTPYSSWSDEQVSTIIRDFEAEWAA